MEPFGIAHALIILPQALHPRAIIGTFSIWHMLILMGIVLVLFGKGKISELMGDVAKGIKSFKKGMADDDVAAPAPKPGEPGKIIDANTMAKTSETTAEQRKTG
jgi:sec-independent protein translocase protein TatA